MRLPFVIHITRENARSVFTMDRAFLFYVTPPHTHILSEKSRREQKSLYPTTGRQRIFNPLMGYFYF